MWDYTEKVKDHFLHPRNVGEIENPDAVGIIGNIVCGDALKLTFKVDRKTNRIIDVKFQTFGCASAIASSSVLTELLKGKTIEEAQKITNQDIADYLGGLPEEKMHCSVMAKEALEEAIKNYKGEMQPIEPQGRIVCKCFNVSEEKIRKVAQENHLKTVEEITNFTKAGGACGSCLGEIETILKDVWSTKEPIKIEARSIKKRTNLQKIALIQDILEREIRPSLQADGGDIELIDIEGNKVIVGFRAMCVSCPMGGITLKSIEDKLKEVVGEEIMVVEE